jgi:hypothetical protein
MQQTTKWHSFSTATALSVLQAHQEGYNSSESDPKKEIPA